jgi:hypothetical protein
VGRGRERLRATVWLIPSDARRLYASFSAGAHHAAKSSSPKARNRWTKDRLDQRELAAAIQRLAADGAPVRPKRRGR